MLMIQSDHSRLLLQTSSSEYSEESLKRKVCMSSDGYMYSMYFGLIGIIAKRCMIMSDGIC